MEPFIGQIQLFGFGWAPVGWAVCNGQLLAISQNTALFSLLGTTYGGDGRTTFVCPTCAGEFRLVSGKDRDGATTTSARSAARKASR